MVGVSLPDVGQYYKRGKCGESMGPLRELFLTLKDQLYYKIGRPGWIPEERLVGPIPSQSGENSMSTPEVDFRRIVFKCSECKVSTECCCIERVLNRVSCPRCCRIVDGTRGMEMFWEEFDYFVAEEKKKGVFGAMKSGGVQAAAHTFPELNRPKWELFVERDEYVIELVHRFIHG